MKIAIDATISRYLLGWRLENNERHVMSVAKSAIVMFSDPGSHQQHIYESNMKRLLRLHAHLQIPLTDGEMADGRLLYPPSDIIFGYNSEMKKIDILARGDDEARVAEPAAIICLRKLDVMANVLRLPPARPVQVTLSNIIDGNQM